MRNKTVALYFSNKNHDSLLETVLKALKKMDCKVILFIAEGMTQSVFSDTDIVYQSIISNARFTSSKVFKVFNAADFVIIDQLYSFRELVSFSTHVLKRPNLMLIHNCITWFSPQNPNRLVHKVKHYMTQHIKKKIGYFAVAGENMLTYCTKELDIGNVTLIPFRYADFDPDKDVPLAGYKIGRPIRLVVPGMITNRRNYHELLEAIGQEELKDKVELILLGKPEGSYGQEVLAKVRTLIREGYRITYWEEYISNEDFRAEIRDAHVLFSYFSPNYITNNGQQEVYGVSKETGIALLMYNKAKVGILPAAFNQMETIRNQTITYNSIEELKDILMNIYRGSLDIKEKEINALTNAASMDLKKIVQRLNIVYQSQVR